MKEYIAKLNSPYREFILKYKPQPNSQSFKSDDLKKFFECYKEKATLDSAEQDANLYASIIIFRSLFEKCDFERNKAILGKLGYKQSIITAVSISNNITNMVFRQASSNIKAHAKSNKKRPTDFGFMSQFMLPSHKEGNILDPDGVLENILEVVSSWIFDSNTICKAPPDKMMSKDSSSTLALSDAKSLFDEYARLKLLNWMNNRILHRGWKFSQSKGKTIFAPYCHEIENKISAWFIRLANNQVAYALIDSFTHKNIDKSKIEANKSRTTVTKIKHFKIKNTLKLKHIFEPVETIRKGVDKYLVEMGLIETSYLRFFSGIKFPGLDFTTNDVLKSWHTISDLQRLKAEQNKAKVPNKLSRIIDDEPIYSLSELSFVLEKCTSLDARICKAIVEFLSYKAESRKLDLWSFPFVNIGNDEYVICNAPLKSGNVVWRIEAWMEKGGLANKSKEFSKGTKYENFLRQDLIESISNNPLLRQATYFESGIKKSKNFSEEIDWIFRLENTIFVCEIKCYLQPSNDDIHNYLGNLDAACEQAIRKARYLESHFAKIQSNTPECFFDGPVSYVPLVIINHEIGLSYSNINCSVVDQKFLSSFLSEGTVQLNGRFDYNKKKFSSLGHKYYNSSKEGVGVLLREMKNPLILKRFEENFEWVANLLGDFGGKEIYCAHQLQRELNISELEASFSKQV